jgi:hypothetical protein
MVLFYDTFPRRPRMAVASVLARLRREPLADLPIASQVNQLCRECEYGWRDRLLSPLVTLRLFLLQVLHGNTSIAHLRQLAGLNFAPASYCEARQRLPLEVILALLAKLAQWAKDHRGCWTPLPPGRRVLIVDGSNFSTPDTPELRRQIGLYPSAKPGVAYPMCKLLGLVDLATGLFVQVLGLPMILHEASQVVHLHPFLQAGDVLLGDRAFCSFAHLALLNQRGVFACFRLHQHRKPGTANGIQRWRKAKKGPGWMDPCQHALLPAWLDVRVVSYTVAQAGFRSRRVTLATTLLDEQLWPDEKLAELYGQRWQIESCFNHLKTTMGLNLLKCKTPDGVMKELAMYLLAYNLVRLAMLRMAARQCVRVRHVSFVDALRWLTCRMLGLEGVQKLIINPNRRGRWQPRVIRGRMKQYDLMVRPRSEYKMPENSERKP